MKLYATTTSERGGRSAKKGGNDYIRIALTAGNQEIAVIIVQSGSLVIYHRPDWTILTGGHKTEGVIQTIKA